MSETTIICGSCRVAVETVPNPKDHDMVSCPRCGNSDTFKNVMRSVQDFISNEMASSLDGGMRSALRGSKVMKVTSQPVRKGRYPFICDMKL